MSGETNPLALDRVLTQLRCPVCSAEFERQARTLTCTAGHSFDIARQGYVNLAVGEAGPGTGDSAELVAAREAFLGAGHYRPIADAIGEAAGTPAEGLLVDLAGGTGYYSSACLEAAPDRLGVCLDLSAPALRRAARAHPRCAALGSDVWRQVPLAAASAAVVLSVFGPRNAAEIERVLAPNGVLVVVSPLPGHLHEMIEPLGMIGVDPHKATREATAFDRFRLLTERAVSFGLTLDHATLTALAGMGPSAVHTAPADLADRIGRLPDPMTVTVAVRLARYVPRRTIGADVPTPS